MKTIIKTEIKRFTPEYRMHIHPFKNSSSPKVNKPSPEYGNSPNNKGLILPLPLYLLRMGKNKAFCRSSFLRN
jgi:hypothetical protein